MCIFFAKLLIELLTFPQAVMNKIFNLTWLFCFIIIILFSFLFYSRELGKNIITSNNTDRTTISWDQFFKRFTNLSSSYIFPDESVTTLLLQLLWPPWGQPPATTSHSRSNALQEHCRVRVSRDAAAAVTSCVSVERLRVSPQQPGSCQWPGAWSGTDYSSVPPPHDTGHDGPPGGRKIDQSIES